MRRASARCSAAACRPAQRTVALARTTAATFGMARTTGTAPPRAASMREVGKPAAIEMKSVVAAPRGPDLLEHGLQDLRLHGENDDLRLPRGLVTLFSVTAMPSADASAARFAALGV